MTAVDSSVAIAAFASWHEAHDVARRILSAAPVLPAHAAVETYSVLTRLPEPFRFSASTAEELIIENFSERLLSLSAAGYASLIVRAPALGITGGTVYDAVVAATAKEADHPLMTRDRRAAAVYDALGVTWEFVG